MGIVLDPNFSKNHWLYLYYAHPTETKHILARMELRGDELLVEQQKVLLEGSYTAGGMLPYGWWNGF
jgi:cytochrome c